MKSRLLATDTLDVSGKILKNALSAIARHRGDFRPARSWPALLLIMLAAVNTAEGPTLFGPPSIAFASAPASPTTQPTGIATADGPLKLIDLTFPSDPPINDPQLTQIDPPKPEQIWRAVRSHLAPDPAIDSDPLSLIPATTPSSPTPLDPAPIAIDNNPPSSSNDPQPIAASPTATPPVVLASPRPPFIPPPGGPLVGSTPSIPEPCGIFLGVITPLLLQRPRRSV